MNPTIAAILFASALLAQQPNAAIPITDPSAATVGVVRRRAVAPENANYHIIAVVPMTGRGTKDDPKRPLYVPAALKAAASPSDLIGFTHIPSDDGNFAIVEFVAADRTAFSAVMADKSLLVFEKGKHQKIDIENALQSIRKGFKLQDLSGVVR